MARSITNVVLVQTRHILLKADDVVVSNWVPKKQTVQYCSIWKTKFKIRINNNIYQIKSNGWPPGVYLFDQLVPVIPSRSDYMRQQMVRWGVSSFRRYSTQISSPVKRIEQESHKTKFCWSYFMHRDNVPRVIKCSHFKIYLCTSSAVQPNPRSLAYGLRLSRARRVVFPRYQTSDQLPSQQSRPILVLLSRTWIFLPACFL